MEMKSERKGRMKHTRKAVFDVLNDQSSDQSEGFAKLGAATGRKLTEVILEEALTHHGDTEGTESE